MSDSTPKTTAELLTRLDRAWDALEATVRGLSCTQLTDVRDPAGWAAKDHLMHVAAWEAAFLGRLAGRSTHESLGLDAATLEQDEDTVNAALFERHRNRPLAEVLETARATHAAARARLAALRDHAVAGPATALLPPGAGADGGAAAWIGGNTWEHYEAHHGWIRALVGA
jgi:hypothetical protein